MTIKLNVAKLLARLQRLIIWINYSENLFQVRGKRLLQKKKDFLWLFEAQILLKNKYKCTSYLIFIVCHHHIDRLLQES